MTAPKLTENKVFVLMFVRWLHVTTVSRTNVHLSSVLLRANSVSFEKPCMFNSFSFSCLFGIVRNVPQSLGLIQLAEVPRPFNVYERFRHSTMMRVFFIPLKMEDCRWSQDFVGNICELGLVVQTFFINSDIFVRVFLCVLPVVLFVVCQCDLHVVWLVSCAHITIVVYAE